MYSRLSIERFSYMKSMLHEASSVAKAIEKAWVESGKPGEFTINILELGEKNFFGFTKRPAIVSISYDPKKLNERQEREQRKVTQQKRNERSDDRKQNRQYPDLNATASKDSRQQTKNQRSAQQPARPVQKDGERGANQLVQRQERAQVDAINARHDRGAGQGDFWTQELVDQITPWLNELCTLMEVSTDFVTKIDKKILYIGFQERVFKLEDERAISMSLAYLLMQFLKKTHKKKFHNYHIVISFKGLGAHDKRSSETPE